jgi:D-glycerate 3-kinase
VSGPHDRDQLERALAQWIAARATGFRAAHNRAMVLGVCAPQGAGKSTLCSRLCALLGGSWLRAASVSIDDFYLTRSEQIALSDTHPGNRYLEVRGYPGTHDIPLATAVIDALVRAEKGRVVRVPTYDKGAFEGAGDRAPEASWSELEGPLDVVLFEGWMLGFEPTQSSVLAGDRSLAECNELLRGYAPWRSRVDHWLLMEGREVEYVLEWRVDSERARRARDGRGLSDEGARAYVERFLPAYRAWWTREATSALAGRAARVVLDRDRSCVELELPRE